MAKSYFCLHCSSKACGDDWEDLRREVRKMHGGWVELNERTTAESIEHNRTQKTERRLSESCGKHETVNTQTDRLTQAHALSHTLFIPPLSLRFSGLRAINSWNWALANSFIQSLVERQNAHCLWCAPRQEDTGSGGWLPRQPLHPTSTVFLCLLSKFPYTALSVSRPPFTSVTLTTSFSRC